MNRRRHLVAVVALLGGCEEASQRPGPDTDGGVNLDAATPDAVATENAAPRVVAGWKHTCVLLPAGNVRCWGLGQDGQLGYGNTANIGDDETPASAGDVNVGGRVVQLAAGGKHTCALLDDATVRCWGNGQDGQLGYGNTASIGDDETPASAGFVPVGGKVVQIAAGFAHTCALLEGGWVRCWGKGQLGQLGYGNPASIGDDEPAASAGNVEVGELVSQITVGEEHTCAVTTNGSLLCWGSGLAGQTGYFSPTQFAGHPGEALSCETILMGRFNGNQALLFDVGDDETPASMGRIALVNPVARASAGGAHTCVLTAGGETRCWGYTAAGQIGYPAPVLTSGNVDCSVCPGRVEVGAPVIDVMAGGRHTCALIDGGKVRCWGLNESGQSGIEGNGLVLIPSEVDVGGVVRSLAVGGSHTCAVLEDGGIRCWGFADEGQLGFRPDNRHDGHYSIGRHEPLAAQAPVRYLD